MTRSKKVLVLDNSPDLLELSRILLSAEGYDVVTSNYEGASLAMIRDQAPDVILFDLVKDSAEPWALLEQLRADAELRDVGVMVTSAVPSLIDKALGDPTLRVAGGLVMPFDIDDLYARLDETINKTQSAAPADGRALARNPAVAAAAQIIADEKRNILFRWVQRISTLRAYRQRADLDLQAATGGMEAILDLIVSQVGEADGALPAVGPVAGHVRLRVTQGVSLPDIIREYQLLRMEIGRALRGTLHQRRLGLADILAAQERINETIDQVTVLSVEIARRD